MNCPRCESEKIKMMVQSPVGDVWEMYLCEECFYSWRSTEDVRVLDKFKLTKEKIDSMDVIPPVPPLE